VVIYIINTVITCGAALAALDDVSANLTTEASESNFEQEICIYFKLSLNTNIASDKNVY